MAKQKLTQQELRRIFILSAILLVASLTVFNVIRVKDFKQQETARELAQEQVSGKALIGGNFTMTNQDGKRIKFSDTNGKIRLIFFGFTNCPDVCPTTLLTITNTMNTLGDKAKLVQPILVTVDPKRDTPEVLKKYLSNFYPGIIGLTGTKEELEQATKAYKAYYSAPVSTAGHEDAGHEESGDHSLHGMDSSYSVDHSGFIYVMDTKGNYLTHKPYSVPETELVATLTPYLK